MIRFLFLLCGLLSTPCVLAGQLAIHGRAGIGWAEHRVRDGDAGGLLVSSGMLMGGAVGIVLRDNLEVWGEAVGGRLRATESSALDDRDVAQVRLLAGLRVRPWLLIEGGPVVRTYRNPLARQRWTAVYVGGAARVPLLESLQGVLRAYWMPVMSASTLPHPDVAFAAGAGMEWRGRLLTLNAHYLLERYDFPATTGAGRLEEFSSLQVRVGVRWHRRTD